METYITDEVEFIRAKVYDGCMDGRDITVIDELGNRLSYNILDEKFMLLFARLSL